MFRFNNRKPVELRMQHPVAEPPARTGNTELDCLDLVLWTQARREPEHRDLDLIDRVLDERLAVALAMVPVIPGRPL